MSVGARIVASDVTLTRDGRWRWDVRLETPPPPYDEDDISLRCAVVVTDGGWEQGEAAAKATANRRIGAILGRR